MENSNYTQNTTDVGNEVLADVMHLLPCPFCGDEPFINQKEAAYIVMCPSCVTVQIVAIEKETAIQRWNKRQ